MPIEEKGNDCVQTCPPPTRGMGEAIVGMKQGLTKQRYTELVQLAKIASEELTKHGLLRHEYCEFGRIMEKVIQLD